MDWASASSMARMMLECDATNFSRRASSSRSASRVLPAWGSIGDATVDDSYVKAAADAEADVEVWV